MLGQYSILGAYCGKNPQTANYQECWSLTQFVPDEMFWIINSQLQ